MLNYTTLLEKLYLLNRSSSSGEWSLDPMKEMMSRLGHPHSSYPIIHVAGTNGKGSVSVKLAKTLELSGYKVGCYTSPHLMTYRERIQINSQMIPKDSVVQHLTAILKQEIPLSFFELTTALAFTYFAEEKIDIAVIETGLGGRLDATNVVNPLLSVITSIGKDHCEILGDTLDSIAIEKAGIIKKGAPVVVGPSANLPPTQLAASNQKVPLHVVEEILTDYDKQNQKIARACLDLLENTYPLSKEAIEQGLRQRQLCRFQVLEGNDLSFLPKNMRPPSIVLDVAHNLPAIEALSQSISKTRPIHALCSLSKDKEIKKFIINLATFCERVHLAEGQHPRLAKQEELVGYSETKPLPETLDIALREATKEDATLLICGSCFMMAEVLPLLRLANESDPQNLNELHLPKSTTKIVV